MPYPDEDERLFWQNSPPDDTPSNSSWNEDEGTTRTNPQAAEREGDSLNSFLHEPWNPPPDDTPSNSSLNEDEGTTRTNSPAAEEEGDSLNSFLHEPREDDRRGSAGKLEPEWGTDQTREFDPVYLASGDEGHEDEEDKGGASPEDADSFMFEDDARPKEHVQFFFEMDYADQDVDDRLPPHIKQNRTARKQVRQLVKQHVQQELSSLDLEGKFFIQHSIPQHFEFDDRVYMFSYYLLPYELPVEPPPTTKSENLEANFEAEPQATQLAFSNIFVLFSAFALSLVVISCDTLKCQRAGNIGQLLVGFAALVLACVEGYMQFLVASPPPSAASGVAGIGPKLQGS